MKAGIESSHLLLSLPTNVNTMYDFTHHYSATFDQCLNPEWDLKKVEEFDCIREFSFALISWNSTHNMIRLWFPTTSSFLLVISCRATHTIASNEGKIRMKSISLGRNGAGKVWLPLENLETFNNACFRKYKTAIACKVFFWRNAFWHLLFLLRIVIFFNFSTWWLCWLSWLQYEDK